MGESLRLLGFAVAAALAFTAAPARASVCEDSAAPLRCQAYRQGAQSCVDLAGGARRACVAEFTPSLSCRGRPERCLYLPGAQRQCDALSGAERRRCVLDALPPAGCKTHANPEQCRRLDAAERACIAETGSAGRRCVADRLR